MNLSNGVPPDRTQVPGPTAALKVSGSQASIMVIGRSSPPAIDCRVAVDPPFEVGIPMLEGEPRDDEEGVGADGLWSQLAANAVAASTTSTRRLMLPPVCRVAARATCKEIATRARAHSGVRHDWRPSGGRRRDDVHRAVSGLFSRASTRAAPTIAPE